MLFSTQFLALGLLGLSHAQQAPYTDASTIYKNLQDSLQKVANTLEFDKTDPELLKHSVELSKDLDRRITYPELTRTESFIEPETKHQSRSESFIGQEMKQPLQHDGSIGVTTVEIVEIPFPQPKKPAPILIVSDAPLQKHHQPSVSEFLVDCGCEDETSPEHLAHLAHRQQAKQPTLEIIFEVPNVKPKHHHRHVGHHNHHEHHHPQQDRKHDRAYLGHHHGKHHGKHHRKHHGLSNTRVKASHKEHINVLEAHLEIHDSPKKIHQVKEHRDREGHAFDSFFQKKQDDADFERAIERLERTHIELTEKERSNHVNGREPLSAEVLYALLKERKDLKHGVHIKLEMDPNNQMLKGQLAQLTTEILDLKHALTPLLKHY